MDYDAFMEQAIAQAQIAAQHGDVPIGAVVVDEAGEVIAVGHNRREVDADPCAHAEILALRAAGMGRGRWHLGGCTLVVTLEPCAMCAGAAVLARVDTVVFGATDPKAGAAGSVLDVLADERLNHQPAVVAGVRGAECGQLLKDFFAAKRAARAGDR